MCIDGAEMLRAALTLLRACWLVKQHHASGAASRSRAAASSPSACPKSPCGPGAPWSDSNTSLRVSFDHSRGAPRSLTLYHTAFILRNGMTARRHTLTETDLGPRAADVRFWRGRALAGAGAREPATAQLEGVVVGGDGPADRRANIAAHGEGWAWSGGEGREEGASR